jgi:hypothetical protein
VKRNPPLKTEANIVKICSLLDAGFTRPQICGRLHMPADYLNDWLETDEGFAIDFLASEKQAAIKYAAVNPGKFRQEIVDIVLAETAKGQSMKAAAARAGIDKTTIVNWRRLHPEFSAMYDIAHAEGNAVAIDTIMDFAVGFTKPFKRTTVREEVVYTPLRDNDKQIVRDPDGKVILDPIVKKLTTVESGEEHVRDWRPALARLTATDPEWRTKTDLTSGGKELAAPVVILRNVSMDDI